MSTRQRVARPYFAMSLATMVLATTSGAWAADKGVETLATKS